MTDDVLNFLTNWTAKHDNEMAAGFRGLRQELTNMQLQLSALQREVEGIHHRDMAYRDHLDRLEQRQQTVERRLGLID
jgi:phage shock protein A